MVGRPIGKGRPMTDHRDSQSDDQSMEVPEADAMEQAHTLEDDEDVGRVDPDAMEVPEADALDQRRSIPQDPDDV